MFTPNRSFKLTYFLLIPACLVMISGPITASAEAEPVVGKVTYIIGEPQNALTDGNIPLKSGSNVRQGDTIRNDGKSRITIKFNDGSLVNLGNDTQLVIAEFKLDENSRERNLNFKLLRGHIRILVSKLSGLDKSDVVIETPTFSFRANEGAEFIVSAVPGKEAEKLSLSPAATEYPLLAFNHDDSVVSDFVPYKLLAQNNDPDEVEWWIYVYCIDGTIYAQRLEGGEVYTITPGSSGWVHADYISLTDIPPDFINTMYLVSNVPGSEYGSGPTGVWVLPELPQTGTPPTTPPPGTPPPPSGSPANVPSDFPSLPPPPSPS